MARFTNTRTKRPVGFTATALPKLTYAGGVGFSADEKTELYSRVLTERFTDTFYESASFRQSRMATLAMGIAKNDPVWFSNMVVWLRNEAHTRSAAIFCAAVYANVHSGVDPKLLPAGALSVREVTSKACARADEPVELLAIYQHLFGKSLPNGLRKGLGDAVRRLWNEYSVLKYNRNAGVTMRDVLNLAHIEPDPAKPYQAALFQYIIDKAYDNEISPDVMNRLSTIKSRQSLMAIPASGRRAFAKANPSALDGTTWEFLSSWFDGGMDAEAWEAAIDQMGYMALLRNLRNFEKANVDRASLQKVRDILADPEKVAKARQLPYSFYLAKKYAESDFFTSALNDAFEHATTNVGKLHGNTLVMVDSSGSMGFFEVSSQKGSKISPNEQAGVLAAIAYKVWDADVFNYDSSLHTIKLANKNSTLSNAQVISQNSRGGATYTWKCISEALALKPKGYYSRIIVFTDMQSHDGEGNYRLTSEFEGNVYIWDLQGYGTVTTNLRKPGRYMFAGFDDSSFEMIAKLEAGNGVSWPWEK